jgi:transcriptional regulator with XRE-family HTH domain
MTPERFARLSAGLPLASFAKYAGIDPGMLSRAERGIRPLPPKLEEKRRRALEALTAEAEKS